MEDHVETACTTDHRTTADNSPPAPGRSPMKKRATGLLRKISLFSMSESEVSPVTVLTIQQAILLISAILLVAVILQIPTILYYTNEPPSSTTSSSLVGDIDFHTCSADLSAVSFGNVTLEDFCPEIPPLGNQSEIYYSICLETSLSLVQAIHAINLALNNEECSTAAVPFFCNAIFSLCSDDSYVVDLEEECVQVRDDNCTIEWRVLENIYGVSIPSCESFSVDGTLTFEKAPPVNTCPDQFDLYCDSVCLPSCEDFSQFSHEATVVSYALIITFQLTGVISGVITLIGCLFNRKKMFKFPQIYVVYNTTLVIFILVVLIMPLIFGHEELLCSDSNVIDALETPTGYCQAQGFILQTGILCFFGFWLSHLAHLFFALAFPFRAKKFMSNYGKTAHIVEVIVVVVLASLPGAVIIGTVQYQIDRFPPDVCIPSESAVFFYTFSLAVSIGSTIGLGMLCATFAVLRRNHQLKKARTEEESTNKSKTLLSLMKLLCIGFSTPEAKLFILFWYYVLVVVVLLTHFTVLLYNIESISVNLQNYFTCIAVGNPNCEVFKQKADDMAAPSFYLDLAATLLLCSINLSNLMYVLQSYDIKKFVLRLLKLRKDDSVFNS